MSTTKRLRTKDEELAYKRIMVAAAEAITEGAYRSSIPMSITSPRCFEIAKMVSDDIKRMAKVPL